MGATLEPAGGGRLRLCGELGFESVAALLAKGVSLPGDGAVSVDCSGVTRSNSSGVALLVEWLRNARGRRLSFRNVPPQMMDIIRVADLDGVLPLERPEAAAGERA